MQIVSLYMRYYTFDDHLQEDRFLLRILSNETKYFLLTLFCVLSFEAHVHNHLYWSKGCLVNAPSSCRIGESNTCPPDLEFGAQN